MKLSLIRELTGSGAIGEMNAGMEASNYGKRHRGIAASEGTGVTGRKQKNTGSGREGDYGTQYDIQKGNKETCSNAAAQHPGGTIMTVAKTKAWKPFSQRKS